MPGLPRQQGGSRPLVLQVHGEPVSCPASHQRHGTRRAEAIRARIPILIICFGARCRTRRRAAWVEWPGMPVCSRRRDDVSSYAQALLDRLAGRPSRFPLKQATLQLMTTPAAARTYSSTTRRGQRCRPRSHRKKTKHTKSAARSELSGDQGTESAWLWLGHRFALLPAARQDLPHRELRPYGLHRNHALVGPRLRYLRNRAHQRNPYARESTDLEPGR